MITDVHQLVETASALVLRHPHFTADDLSSLLRGGPNPQQLSRMRAQRSLVGVRIVRRGYLYPAFQFDVERHRVNPHAARVNHVLMLALSESEALNWWWRGTAKDPAPALLLTSGRADEAMPRAQARVTSR
jgi:hypothetical protein